MHDTNDTIVAIATAAGGAGRGIVRMSGPAVVACLATCFRPEEPVELDRVASARSIAGSLRLPPLAAPLPCDLLLWPTRRSYTRQVVAELHTLGSLPLLANVIETLCRSGARPAEPGEFTLRAFLAGRIDLTRAEAVLGVIDASGQRELDVALRQLAGSVATPLVDLRNDLIDLLADLEAGLDFADHDIEFVSQQQLVDRLGKLGGRLSELENQFAGRSTIRRGIRVVFTGRPNAGKSSLFNAVLGRAAALTSAVEGTTRDTVRARCDFGGVECELIDTAGLELGRPRDELAEAVADIARGERDEAQLHILCLDASRPLNRWDLKELARAMPVNRRIVVWTKVDRQRAAETPSENWPGSRPEREQDAVQPARGARSPGPGPFLETSSRTGRGIAALRHRLAEAIRQRSTAGSGAATSGSALADTAARSRVHLRQAADSLQRARRVGAAGDGEALAAVEIRAALLELGKIVGEVYTDDLLDRIFSRFCLGK